MALDTLRTLHDACNPPCVAVRIRRPNCALVISQVLQPQLVGVDCDRCRSFARNEVRPDFILLFGGETGIPSRWFVVEMKSTIRNIGELVGQLQAGADAIRSKSNFSVPSSPTLLTPLILHRRQGAKTADFLTRTISFSSKKFRILHRRCGVSLDQLIS